MNKQGLMFGVLGLIVGLVVGFMGANSLNRSAAGQAPTQPTASAPAISGNGPLPADHPPIGATTGGSADQTAGGQLPQVAQAIERAKQQPQDYEAQMTAADLYYQIQKFDDAAKFYEAASKLKPGEVEPMVKAGNAYFDKAETAAEGGDKAGSTPDFVQAEKWYALALQKDPKDVSVRTDLGLTFFLRTPRDIDRAIKEYKTSLTLNPDHEITLQNLALAYSESGDRDDFNKTVEKLKAVNPNNPVITKTQTAQ